MNRKTRFSLKVVFGLGLLINAAMSLAQPDTGAQTGQQLFTAKCAPCHADAPARPGTQALTLKYRDSKTPAPLEQRTDLTPAYIQAVVRNGLYSMAPLRKTEITDSELADVAAYLSK
jgi:mono/diheme cytochrome c family protein